MPRAERPSSPSDDLSPSKTWRAAGALTPELAAFCQSGVSVVLGTRDAVRQPIAGLGLACREESGGALRILLRRRGNERLLHAIEDGASVAVTFSQPTTHRSIQLKAPRAEVAAVVPADEPALVRQTTSLRDELVDVGYSTAFSTVYCAFERADVVAIVISPENAFVQTPGPGAGSAMP